MKERPLAVLDANVLYPFQLRNFLLHAAEFQLFQPLWSDEILVEAHRNLRKKQGLADAQLTHLFGQMTRAFPEAMGVGSSGAAHLILPHENDRHVIGLAIHHEADFIVTQNTRHFPVAALQPLGIVAVRADTFTCRLAEEDPLGTLEAARAHRASLRSHPLDPAAYLASLRDHAKLPGLARFLRAHGFAPQG